MSTSRWMGAAAVRAVMSGSYACRRTACKTAANAASGVGEPVRSRMTSNRRPAGIPCIACAGPFHTLPAWSFVVVHARGGDTHWTKKEVRGVCVQQTRLDEREELACIYSPDDLQLRTNAATMLPYANTSNTDARRSVAYLLLKPSTEWSMRLSAYPSCTPTQQATKPSRSSKAGADPGTTQRGRRPKNLLSESFHRSDPSSRDTRACERLPTSGKTLVRRR